jgi:molecular chaperone DnaK (HSP70)
MSVIGLDFGSHWASFAVYQSKLGLCEVFADDLGSRAVPCVVAYRGEDVIIGQAALSQQYKNSANTFDDIRHLLDSDSETVHVPVLDRDVSRVTIVSYFFRHIRDQVAQQVGHEVTNTVLSIPSSHVNNETFKNRLIAAAEAGGLCIKSFIPDTTASVIAHSLDTTNVSRTLGSNCTKRSVLVVDLGYTESEVATFEVCGGLITPQKSAGSLACGGSTVIDALTKHCTKDFKRKTKVTCDQNQRSMLRLRKEAEDSVRILSTTQETTIDLDALAEGMDYSGKVSRAKFEDLTLLYFMGVKNLIKSLDVDHSTVTDIIMSGGFSAVPKNIFDLQWSFPNATFLRGHVDPAEAVCLGAALHGMTLSKEGVLDAVPSTSEPLAVLPVSLFLNDQVVFPQGLALPVATVIPVSASTSEDTGFTLSAEGNELAQVAVASSTLDSAEATASLTVTISVSLTGAVDVVVKDVKSDTTLSEVNIPASA